jgi:two-component system NtrC family response regulator/two-component system response regulator PilR (NtrC family)
VREGKFREDLYYRLEVVPVKVPPLRDRLEDLEELVKYFISRVAASEGMPVPGISEGFIDRLGTHAWPGNVRELENLIERLMVVYRPRTLELRHLEEEDPLRFSPAAGNDPGNAETGSRLDHDAIIDALKQCGGNKTKTAAWLGISRRNLYYRMEQLGIG